MAAADGEGRHQLCHPALLLTWQLATRAPPSDVVDVAACDGRDALRPALLLTWQLATGSSPSATADVAACGNHGALRPPLARRGS